MRFEFKSRCFEFPANHRVLFGILNITPDSFSDGGKFLTPENASAHALRLEKEGANVIDVGGESTRPGATPVPAEQEMERVLPVIRILKQRVQIPISVDTTKADVAGAALAEGAEIVNDISGLSADPRMASVVASSGAGLILMHSRGTPATMQTLCNYRNIVEDVKRELHERFRFALSHGIFSNQIAIDPGIGFAKTPEQNMILLRNLKAFAGGSIAEPFPDRPIMVGVSRKSFLGDKVNERGPGTLAAEIWAHQQGIHMIRTHDVGALRKALETFQAIRGSGLPPFPPLKA